MEIRIESHTLERARSRGTNRAEIEDTIESGTPVPAKYGRLAKTKIFSFDQVRLGRYYERKKGEVIYIADNDVIITVTVYVFYGKWED